MGVASESKSASEARHSSLVSLHRFTRLARLGQVGLAAVHSGGALQAPCPSQVSFRPHHLNSRNSSRLAAINLSRRERKGKGGLAAAGCMAFLLEKG